jgi:hypothetical protein
VTLKRNQPGLYKQCEAILNSRPADDCDDRSNHGHGRHERRIVAVWNAPEPGEALAVNQSWTGLKRIVRVERLRSVAMSEPRWETTYYITSRTNDSAYALGKMIRGHWAIENRLHWVKDVQQNEDNNHIRGGTAPENISLLKTWALSLFRINGYDSIKNATISFANKITLLAKLVRT